MTANSPFDDAETAGLPENTGLVAKPSAGDNAAPLSISEISALLKRTVEDRFGFVRVKGELSGVKRAASGHLYLSLKDAGARLDGVMWKGSVARLGFLPEDGVEVVATGKLTTYPGRSNYQLVIDRMEVAGEGALLALLAKTKARLEAAGIAIDTAAGGAEILRKHMARAADDLADYFLKRARSEGFGRIAGEDDLGAAFQALRPLGLEAVRVVFAQEMERVLRKLVESGKTASLPVKRKKSGAP